MHVLKLMYGSCLKVSFKDFNFRNKNKIILKHYTLKSYTIYISDIFMGFLTLNKAKVFEKLRTINNICTTKILLFLKFSHILIAGNFFNRSFSVSL